jgi:hypothetical protein
LAKVILTKFLYVSPAQTIPTRRESPSTSTLRRSQGLPHVRFCALSRGSSRASTQVPCSSRRLMQWQIPPGRTFSYTTPTLAPILAAAVRGQALAGVASRQKKYESPRARRWPPTGPTPPGHRPSRGGR